MNYRKFLWRTLTSSDLSEGPDGPDGPNYTLQLVPSEFSPVSLRSLLLQPLMKEFGLFLIMKKKIGCNKTFS